LDFSTRFSCKYLCQCCSKYFKNIYFSFFKSLTNGTFFILLLAIMPFPKSLPRTVQAELASKSYDQPWRPMLQLSASITQGATIDVEPATSLSNCLMMSSIPARTQGDVLNNHKELVPHPHLSHGLVCNIPWTGLPDRTPTSPRCLLFPRLSEATKCCRSQDIILERALIPSQEINHSLRRRTSTTRDAGSETLA